MFDNLPISTVDDYLALVHEVVRFLSSAEDLSPHNRELSALLSRFVRTTMQPRPASDIAAILQDPFVKKATPHLRALLGRTEYAMEHFSAQAILGLTDAAGLEPYASFDNFIYMDNYRALVDQEIAALGWPKKMTGLNIETQSVAFVGAGPLPISAILFHLRTGMPVTCIDSDPQAHERGLQLLRYLAATWPKRYGSLDKSMSYVLADGAKHDYVTHPIVFIASLIDNKDAVLTQITQSSNTHATVVIRTAEGLATLLYEPYATQGGLEDYNVYLRKATQPSPLTINTSLVFRFPSGKNFPSAKARIMGPDDLLQLQGLRQRWRPRTQAHLILV
jgi:hypothetical protein